MEKEKKRAPRAKFYVEQQHWAVQTAIIFMALSAVFRIVGCWGKWDEPFFAATQIALPLMCNILFILCLVLLGKKALTATEGDMDKAVEWLREKGLATAQKKAGRIAGGRRRT